MTNTNTLDQDFTVERKYQIAGYAIDRWYDDPDPQALHQHVEDLVEEFNITALELWPAVAVLLAELYAGAAARGGPVLADDAGDSEPRGRLMRHSDQPCRLALSARSVVGRETGRASP